MPCFIINTNMQCNQMTQAQGSTGNLPFHLLICTTPHPIIITIGRLPSAFTNKSIYLLITLLQRQLRLRKSRVQLLLYIIITNEIGFTKSVQKVYSNGPNQICEKRRWSVYMTDINQSINSFSPELPSRPIDDTVKFIFKPRNLNLLLFRDIQWSKRGVKKAQC